MIGGGHANRTGRSARQPHAGDPADEACALIQRGGDGWPRRGPGAARASVARWPEPPNSPC